MTSKTRLKELFDYDPVKGVLVRKITICRRAKKGDTLKTHDHKGYVRNVVDGRLYFVHRLIWLFHYGEWPKHQLDHVNGIKDDNRIENLREANNSQNKCNSKVRKDSRSGLKGVVQDMRTGRWRAHICLNGKRYWLGFFATKEEAYEKRLSANALHGQFANKG